MFRFAAVFLALALVSAVPMFFVTSDNGRTATGCATASFLGVSGMCAGVGTLQKLAPSEDAPRDGGSAD